MNIPSDIEQPIAELERLVARLNNGELTIEEFIVARDEWFDRVSKEMKNGKCNIS